jgi:PAS domain S-box-containing protein
MEEPMAQSEDSGARRALGAYLPYIAIVTLGVIAYFALRTEAVNDRLTFEALGRIRHEWGNLAFPLQLYTVIAIALVAAALGPVFESVAVLFAAVFLVLWSIFTILGALILFASTGIAIDFVPAVLLPVLVFLRAIGRQVRRRDRALFVKEMHALQEHALFRSVLENPFEGVVVVNYRNEIIYANRFGLTMFGCTEREMISMKVDELNPSLWQGRLGLPLSRLLGRSAEKGEQVGPFESSGLRRDGTIFPMNVIVGLCTIQKANHPLERRRKDRVFFICHLVDLSMQRVGVESTAVERA